MSGHGRSGKDAWLDLMKNKGPWVIDVFVQHSVWFVDRVRQVSSVWLLSRLSNVNSPAIAFVEPNFSFSTPTVPFEHIFQD